MRRLLVPVMLGLAVASANAADLPLPAKELPPAQGYVWTGFYVGANVGGAWDPVDYSGSDALGGVTTATFAGSYHASGVLGGGQFGFNYQFPNNLVVGLSPITMRATLRGQRPLASPQAVQVARLTSTRLVRYGLDSAMP